MLVLARAEGQFSTRQRGALKQNRSENVWYLKQLFTMTYRSNYRDAADRKHFAVWRMWMGRVFQYEHFYVSDSPISRESGQHGALNTNLN